MKIIDCFTFNFEIELLNYRLNILNDVVDYFVLVEATHTHSGEEKELFFEKNKEIFKKFNDKIIHIIVDDFAYTNKPTPEQIWINENYQRDCIYKGISKIKLENEDCIIVADLDEIPDCNTLLKIKQGEIPITFNTFGMDLYYYNLHSKISFLWNSTKIITYEKYKELNISFNKIRNDEKSKQNIIEKGGHHLSYFMDIDSIIKKTKNNAPHSLNNEWKYGIIENANLIKKQIDSIKDIYNRKFFSIDFISIEENPYLPKDYEFYLKKYL